MIGLPSRSRTGPLEPKAKGNVDFGRRHEATRFRWPWWELAVGLVIGLVALIPVANVMAPSLPFDDAYISFAYAAHLVAGHGLRLSVGSAPVEAFSDPLWVMLMAAGKAVGVTIPTWSRIVNVVMIALLAATTAGLARRLNPKAPAWMAVAAAALVALVPAVVYQAVGGLESLLFAVLFNCILLAALADRAVSRSMSVTTSILCFLLFLTRPEGLVVWILVWLASWTWTARHPRPSAGRDLVPCPRHCR